MCFLLVTNRSAQHRAVPSKHLGSLWGRADAGLTLPQRYPQQWQPVVMHRWALGLVCNAKGVNDHLQKTQRLKSQQQVPPKS